MKSEERTTASFKYQRSGRQKIYLKLEEKTGPKEMAIHLFRLKNRRKEEWDSEWPFYWVTGRCVTDFLDVWPVYDSRDWRQWSGDPSEASVSELHWPGREWQTPWVSACSRSPTSRHGAGGWASLPWHMLLPKLPLMPKFCPVVLVLLSSPFKGLCGSLSPSFKPLSHGSIKAVLMAGSYFGVPRGWNN